MLVTIATSIKYGNYQYLKGRVKNIEALIRHYSAAFKKEFNFNPTVEIHIRPIRGNTKGRAWSDTGNRPAKKTNVIEIDPRIKKFEDIIETIAHELTHSEQYYEKRLIPAGKVHSIWNNVEYRRGTTHQQYLNRPWEIEARERASKFVKDHFKHQYLDTFSAQTEH